MIALLAVWSANLTGKFIHSLVLMAFNLLRPDSAKAYTRKYVFCKTSPCNFFTLLEIFIFVFNSEMTTTFWLKQSKLDLHETYPVCVVSFSLHVQKRARGICVIIKNWIIV